MKVDVNNLRMIGLRAYSSLTNTLNKENWRGTITIEEDEIAEAMEDLRCSLSSLACMYIDGDESFKPMSEVLDKVPHFEKKSKTA
jgi:hypothetical protein